VLGIQLISGQHLPSSPDRQAGDIIQPYVKIRVLGHPADTASWVSNTVPNNGFNPSWQEDVTFTIKVPELALVEFKARSCHSFLVTFLLSTVEKQVKDGGRTG
jgi:phosphatidylinositol phospholipase C eta